MSMVDILKFIQKYTTPLKGMMDGACKQVGDIQFPYKRADNLNMRSHLGVTLNGQTIRLNILKTYQLLERTLTLPSLF